MSDVKNNGGSTGKLLGGITGKGFLPGKSGNIYGRPSGLASEIRKHVGKNGEKLIEFHLAVLNDEDYKGQKPTVHDRAKAAEWLTERGFGKAIQELKVGGTDDERPILFDFTTLSNAELDQYRGLLAKVLSRGSESSQSGNGRAG